MEAIGKPRESLEPEPFLETDSLVDFTLAAMDGKNDGNIVPIILRKGDDTLMWFFFYLSAILGRTALAPVDIGRFIDPNLPPMIHSTD